MSFTPATLMVQGILRFSDQISRAPSDGQNQMHHHLCTLAQMGSGMVSDVQMDATLVPSVVQVEAEFLPQAVCDMQTGAHVLSRACSAEQKVLLSGSGIQTDCASAASRKSWRKARSRIQKVCLGAASTKSWHRAASSLQTDCLTAPCAEFEPHAHSDNSEAKWSSSCHLLQHARRISQQWVSLDGFVTATRLTDFGATLRFSLGQLIQHRTVAK